MTRVENGRNTISSFFRRGKYNFLYLTCVSSRAWRMFLYETSPGTHGWHGRSSSAESLFGCPPGWWPKISFCRGEDICWAKLNHRAVWSISLNFGLMLMLKKYIYIYIFVFVKPTSCVVSLKLWSGCSRFSKDFFFGINNVQNPSTLPPSGLISDHKLFLLSVPQYHCL